MEKCSDIELLKIFLNNKDDYRIRKSSSGDFSIAEKVYSFSNENLLFSIKDSKKDKKILTVTASGDQMLRYVEQGATDITCFDCNVFTKYYSRLKTTLINNVEFMGFDNFYNIILWFFGCYDRDFFNKSDKRKLKSLCEDVYNSLSDNDKKFWDVLFNYADSLKEKGTYPLFRDACLNRIFIYEDRFYKVKENLKNSKISYIDSDISVINKKLPSKDIFDEIYLSNIFNYLKRNEINIIMDKLYPKLADKGSIISYNLMQKKLYGFYENKENKYEQHDYCEYEYLDSYTEYIKR